MVRLIANPKWFTRRKYLGWGVGIKTWQGWAYIGIFITLLLSLNYISKEIGSQIPIYVTWALVGILIIDMINVMLNFNLDERDKVHEAIAERNSLWAILTVLLIGAIIESAYYNITTGTFYINPIIVSAIVIGLIVKAISNYWLDKNN